MANRDDKHIASESNIRPFRQKDEDGKSVFSKPEKPRRSLKGSASSPEPVQLTPKRNHVVRVEQPQKASLALHTPHPLWLGVRRAWRWLADMDMRYKQTFLALLLLLMALVMFFSIVLGFLSNVPPFVFPWLGRFLLDSLDWGALFVPVGLATFAIAHIVVAWTTKRINWSLVTGLVFLYLLALVESHVVFYRLLGGSSLIGGAFAASMYNLLSRSIPLPFIFLLLLLLIGAALLLTFRVHPRRAWHGSKIAANRLAQTAVWTIRKARHLRNKPATLFPPPGGDTENSSSEEQGMPFSDDTDEASLPLPASPPSLASPSPQGYQSSRIGANGGPEARLVIPRTPQGIPATVSGEDQPKLVRHWLLPDIAMLEEAMIRPGKGPDRQIKFNSEDIAVKIQEALLNLGIPTQAHYKRGTQTFLQFAISYAEESEGGAIFALRSELGSRLKLKVLHMEMLGPGHTELALRIANPNMSLDVLTMAAVINKTLADFHIEADIDMEYVRSGPTVIQFGISPGDGVKVSRIMSLRDDLALKLKARSIRMEAPIPGRPVVGLEIPNPNSSMVTLRELLESEEWTRYKGKLPIALGKDVSGAPKFGDLTKMPHLLIAGATGAGKSVCLNSIIACLLCFNSPDEVRLLMIDPKMVELTLFNGVPHLLAPVVTDMEKVVGTLKRAVIEMEQRYSRFAKYGVRALEGYNQIAAARGLDKLPFIVLIIDELADLMMTAPDEVEMLICRLAQKARATGIHLVVATQRPSVDVITGLIKANFPSRIAFMVSSQVDSRTILDMGGAERLLGRGDMLYVPAEESKPIRVQGTFLSDNEVLRIVEHWREHSVPAVEMESWQQQEIWHIPDPEEEEEDGPQDDLLEDAIAVVQQYERASTSLLQRRLRIGYSRAARLIDLLEQRGIIGQAETGGRSREVYRSAVDEIDLNNVEQLALPETEHVDPLVKPIEPVPAEPPTVSGAALTSQSTRTGTRRRARLKAVEADTPAEGGDTPSLAPTKGFTGPDAPAGTPTE